MDDELACAVRAWSDTSDVGATVDGDLSVGGGGEEGGGEDE